MNLIRYHRISFSKFALGELGLDRIASRKCIVKFAQRSLFACRRRCPTTAMQMHIGAPHPVRPISSGDAVKTAIDKIRRASRGDNRQALVRLGLALSSLASIKLTSDGASCRGISCSKNAKKTRRCDEREKCRRKLFQQQKSLPCLAAMTTFASAPRESRSAERRRRHRTKPNKKPARERRRNDFIGSFPFNFAHTMN